MKNILTLVFLLSASLSCTYSQSQDSLVLFNCLRYQTGIEQKAATNFIVNKKDTLMFFLSIDQTVTGEEILHFEQLLNRFVTDLKTNTATIKDLKKKIRIVYNQTHDKFLKKYNDNVFLQDLFKNGVYNCVTASILYAIIFDRLEIPYKIMASTNHVYLIANPGSKSVVIETTNPGFENMIFTGEFKQQYVNNLRSSKIISESDYKSKSVEEIFEEKFKEVKDASFNNLPGFLYNNKAITQIEKNDYGSAVDYLQKSYYFYPDNQVRYMLYNSLLYQIEKCDFEKVSDIDYIGQFSRFGENDMNLTTTMFGNVINNKLQYSNKEQYCDSLYKRICKFIPNQKMKNEIDFSFNLIMAIRFQNKEKGFNYALNAVQIKSNHNDANNLFIRQLSRKIDNIYDPKALLDSISIYKSKFESEQVTDFLNKNQQIAYLNLAKKAFDKNNLQEGEKYVLLFESNSKAPIENSNIRFEAEKTYYAYSAYFYRKQNKTARSNVIKRGLKYLPDSYMLKIGN